nr:aminoglycoside phosphotransferase family protein [Oryzibacter oryziterrae]
MSVRLPSAECYAPQVEREQLWLPVLAPQLPFAIPCPLAEGRPSADHPWPWSIYEWIPGQRADEAAIADITTFATDLAGFLTRLWRIGTDGAPHAGQQTFHRGGDLRVYDGEARQVLGELADEADVPLMTDLWDLALASTWQDKPVWVHGDMAVGNLLVREGKLAAVIDFGCCCIGDPACDLVIAWTLFDQPARRAFRREIGVDRHTWERARGWCLWKALISIAGARGRDEGLADRHRRWIAEILADDGADM